MASSFNTERTAKSILLVGSIFCLAFTGYIFLTAPFVGSIVLTAQQLALWRSALGIIVLAILGIEFLRTLFSE